MPNPTRALGRLATAVLSALLVLPVVAGPTAAASTSYSANCSVNLRASTTTDAAVLDTIAAGTIVIASGTVSGGDWAASDCGGTSASGSSWYVITAVNGSTASNLYGVATVYAATGLFSAVTAPSSSSLEGVDVSHWQGTIDYAKVFASGRRFVIAKATEGIGYVDPSWTTNRTAAPAAGVRVGGYHYARPDLNGTISGATGEADWFVSQLDLQPGMLIPALDLEVSGGLSVANLTAWVKAWLGEVTLKAGVAPMIYVSPSFWRTYLGDSAWFAQNGYKVLWIAHWTSASQPTVPASNWGGRSWTFWQYRDDGTVPGISGAVDHDRYNGTDLTRVTYGATFRLGLGSPSDGSESAAAATTTTTKQGSTASVSVSIDRTFFTLPVSVSVSGLPSSITASLKPSSTSGSSATLSLATTHATATGSYGFTVSGTANGVTRTVGGSLAVTDGNPPSVVGPRSRLATGTMGVTVPVLTSWSASDPSGIGFYRLDHELGVPHWVVVSLANPTSRALNEGVAVGSTFRYTVRATDKAGNASAWTFGPSLEVLRSQQTSTSIAYSSAWKTGTAATASGGSVRYTTTAGASATYTFSGRSIAWVADRGPTRGSARIYVDGIYTGLVSLHASSYQWRQIVYEASWSTSGTHTIKIVAVGTAGHPRVDVDAFLRMVDVA